MSREEKQMKKSFQMADFGYDESWRVDFFNNVLAKTRGQDVTFIEIKLKANDTIKKHENLA